MAPSVSQDHGPGWNHTDLFGADPIGLLIYTDQGFFSAHIMGKDRENHAVPIPLRGTDAEKVAANDSYIGYCGSYDLEHDRVTHHVRVSLFPNWVGNDQVRQVEIEGDRLTLVTPPFKTPEGSLTATLVWEKAK